MKVIVTDLDGTLLNSKSRISDFSYKVFKELKKKWKHCTH